MYIEELKEGDSDDKDQEEETVLDVSHGEIRLSDAKRALIVVGSRFLFYPTLLYNVIRNKIQSEFHWWDLIDEFVLLGAVPFPTDVPRLKQIGVHGVITLNEPYETLVPTSLYHAHGIDHLVIPTRDYLFAPSFGDICRAVDFIHKNASCGRMTYVHCKAGRGRSTTIVLCYLIQHKQMSPSAAYEYVKLSRPRVLLAASQWQAVQEYYQLQVKTEKPRCLDNQVAIAPHSGAAQNPEGFGDSSVVVVTESDLDGYDGSNKSGIVGNDIWAELSWVYKIHYSGQAALAKFSCLWLRYHAPNQAAAAEKLGRENCLVDSNQMGSVGVDIPIYLLTAVVKCAEKIE